MQRTERNPLIHHMGSVRQHLLDTTSLRSNHEFDVRTIPVWDVTKVARWLASIGMGQYSNLFMNYKVDGVNLLTLDSYRMQRMGVHSVHDIIFMEQKIRELNKSKRLTVCQIDALPCLYYRALNLGNEPPWRYFGELLHCCTPE